MEEPHQLKSSHKHLTAAHYFEGQAEGVFTWPNLLLLLFLLLLFATATLALYHSRFGHGIFARLCLCLGLDKLRILDDPK